MQCPLRGFGVAHGGLRRRPWQRRGGSDRSSATWARFLRYGCLFRGDPTVHVAVRLGRPIQIEFLNFDR